jgi:hypothetical protein
VTVTFAGDPFEADLRAFDDAITSTPFWSATTSEYCDATACIGAGAGGGHATLPAPASTAMADADLRTLLRAGVQDQTLPAPTEGTVYVVFIPSGMSLTSPPIDGGATSCVGFHGYHEHMLIGADDVAYAIIARCADAPSFEAMTMIASHELVEAATDPDLDGFTIDDSAWATWHGGELADVCLGESTTKEGAWTVERTYSSAAAKAGKHPCVPATSADEFGVAPAAKQPGTIHLEVGQTKSVALVAFAAAPGPDFTVVAADPSHSGMVTAALDHATVNDGAPLVLTLTLTKAPPSGSATILLRSTRGSVTGAWPILVLAGP